MTQILDEGERRQQETPKDGNSWEDVSDDEPRRLSGPPSAVSTPSNSFRSATRSGARTRRTAAAIPPQRYIYGDRIPTRAPRERIFPAEPLPGQPAGILDPGLGILGLDVYHYVSDIIGTVLRMKIPISLVLVIFACIYAITITSGVIRTSLAPICSIPIISLACPAFEPSKVPHSDRVPRRADFPRLLDVESKTLESLLEETVDVPEIALEIKHARIATSVLVTLVRVSNLNSRDVLADSLGELVKDVRKVGRGLTRFSSRVGGAVDNVIAFNGYALHAIKAADFKPSAFSLNRLLPFAQSASAPEQVVVRTFTEALNTLSTNMQRLVSEAEASISGLNKLGERLTSIHEIVSREDILISAARVELLGQLGTVLGSNKEELNKLDGHRSLLDEHRALLRGVGGYRDRAHAHVVATLHMLETMAEDIEELRERVAAPQLVGETIPVRVHIKSLRKGLERLKGRRAAARRK
ncbi:hypothetical protein BJY52DRAFT_75619 [Lactarius psammicola]|nr:hypothetical protein BJY52DRAFT_75619 [Lactarius psammicola]